VRRHVAASPLSVAGNDLSLRVSIGVATLNAGNGDLTSLLRDADRALYSAKRAGRDRVAAASHAAAGVAFSPASPLP